LLNERSDEELMIAYQLGEADAFEELYSRYAPKVLGFLQKKLPSDALARDVFQSTFLKLHRCRARYDASFPFVPWLFTICRSEMLDALKKAHVRNETPVERLPDVAAPIQGESPELDLGGLSTQQRAALEYRYGAEFSFEEIAARMETSPANARQLVSRALRALRGFYGK